MVIAHQAILTPILWDAIVLSKKFTAITIIIYVAYTNYNLFIVIAQS